MTNHSSSAMRLHFAYMAESENYYKQRDSNPAAIGLCIESCRKGIENVSGFIHAWLAEERRLNPHKKPKLPRITFFERLAIIYEKQGDFQAAIDICQHAMKLGLHDPDKCYSPCDFEGRIARLEKKLSKGNQAPAATHVERPTAAAKRYKKETVKPTEERGIPIRWVPAVKQSQTRGSKALYLGRDGQPVTIESLALEHYAELGYSGLHSENQYWWSTMALLFWDVLFARLPDVYSPLFEFPSLMQDMPRDLFTASFYERRRDVIAGQMRDLIRLNLEDKLRQAFKEHYQKPCRPIDWGMFSIDELALSTRVLTPNQLMRILMRLLENFNENRRGLPDLFMSCDGHPIFVETKSANENLTEEQYAWLEYLRKLGIEVEICRVYTR